jgi:thioredoxin reductase/Fe-S-cluster-containing hydrogenase component 2
VTEVDVLIVGGGPAGLSAAIELGIANVDVLIVDDKLELGGKLGLQTHNFFGSIRDCNAGMRGMDIGTVLEAEVAELASVKVWLDSPVVGVFVDGLIGVVKSGIFKLIRPEIVLFTTGAREKSLAFPGCDLPGVYGAGAFQTLVNRDMVRASEKLFIVGGGNVGLIAAYHAMQAGIEVLGIVEALPQCGGYKVHLDKVKRLGIPVWTSHTVLRAEGDGRLEKVTIAGIDERFSPLPGTERTIEVDTLLVAVGLAPVDELTVKARKFGFKVYDAGDAAVIAEASAAIFSGKIVGREILKDMGHDVTIPKEWHELLDMLRSKPGPTHEFGIAGEGRDIYPVIRCVQEIPCNPCSAVCPQNSISMPGGKMTDLPDYDGKCLGCTSCLTVCPGLAITLVDKDYDPGGETALALLPWELPHGLVKPGQTVKTVGLEGERVGTAKVIAIKDSEWQNRRQLLMLEAPMDQVDMIAGIGLIEEGEFGPGTPLAESESLDTVVCRCERVTMREIVDYIHKSGTKDFNALKAAIRVGMGPCGGKTCNGLVMRIFYQELGREAEVEKHIERPFFQEVPLKAFLGGDPL